MPRPKSSSDHCFNQYFLSKPDFMHPCLLLLIKIEAQHIACRKVVRIKIIHQLPLSPAIILISMPDLKFTDKLLPPVVDNHVCPASVSCSCLHIKIPNSIDNRLQIKQKKSASDAALYMELLSSSSEINKLYNCVSNIRLETAIFSPLVLFFMKPNITPRLITLL